MNRIVSKIVKKVSNKDISIKNNYKLFRFLQKVANPVILNKDVYEDVYFHLGDRDIRARVFEVENKHEKTKAIIFLHGGGWVIGSIESYTNVCIELSKITNRMVIAIDYRLAPEYPFPNGFNDCYEVIKLIMDNLSTIGLSEEDICLMGDSAGGNLAAAICLKAKKTRDFFIKHQILLYPALQCDYSMNTKYKSVIERGKDYLLTQKQLQEYIELYVPNKEDLNSVYISPLKEKFPFLQPKTLIITADNDPLRDEGRKYAKKLKLFFNPVTYYNFEGAMHGFLTQPVGKEYKQKSYKKIIEFLGDDNGKA